LGTNKLPKKISAEKLTIHLIAVVDTENEKDPKVLLPYQGSDTEAEDSEEMGICNPI
jgi:hypothetical protein